MTLNTRFHQSIREINFEGIQKPDTSNIPLTLLGETPFAPVPEPEAFPKITLVTPCFNQRALLEQCLHSVLSEEYPNLEYIVLDGGSTDGTKELLESVGDHLAFWRSHRDDGPYAAINEGFERSTGEVMGWLNCDDLLHPNGLFNLAEIFGKWPGVEFVTGRRRGFSDIGVSDFPLPIMKWNRERYLQEENLKKPYLFLMQEGTFWRRSLWEKAGASLDLSLEYAADFELWARFMRHAPLYVSDYLTGGFRDHSEEQRSRKYFDNYQEEARSVINRERAEPVEDKSFHHSDPLLILTPESIWKTNSVQIFEPTPLPPAERPGTFQGTSVTAISILTDDKRMLGHSTQSVLQQNYANLEYIVIDVEPNGASREWLSRHSNALTPIECTKKELPSVLQNTLQQSKGELINIHPGSSVFDPYAFRIVSVLRAQNPNVHWLHGRFFGVNDEAKQFWFTFERHFCRQYFLKGNFYEPEIQLESIFFTRELWNSAGSSINTQLEHAFDLDLWLRFSRHAPLHTTPYPLVGFHWPYEGVWSRDCISYYQEAHRLIERELQEMPETGFDKIPPPGLLSIRPG